MQGESDSSCLEPERLGNVHTFFTNIDSESDQTGIEFGKKCVARCCGWPLGQSGRSLAGRGCEGGGEAVGGERERGAGFVAPAPPRMGGGKGGLGSLRLRHRPTAPNPRNPDQNK